MMQSGRADADQPIKSRLELNHQVKPPPPPRQANLRRGAYWFALVLAHPAPVDAKYAVAPGQVFFHGGFRLGE